jgi:hypothetical protein
MAMNSVRQQFKPGWYGLAMAMPLILLLAAWKWIFIPGFVRTAVLEHEKVQLEANVYESAWLDSVQKQLKQELLGTQEQLGYAKSRLLPARPFQQTLDSLRQMASVNGIEILETQVATTRRDSLRTMVLKVHARGTYGDYWKWVKQMENHQPWWTMQELVLKPIGESQASLDGALVLAATGHDEVLP